MKAVHTIFDYLTFNSKNDRQVARVYSGWTVHDSLGQYAGGFPPIIEALLDDEDYDKMSSFIGHLFYKFADVFGANSLFLQRHVTATMLMHLRKFLLLLQQHPDQKYGVTDSNCFHSHRFTQ